MGVGLSDRIQSSRVVARTSEVGPTVENKLVRSRMLASAAGRNNSSQRARLPQDISNMRGQMKVHLIF